MDDKQGSKARAAARRSDSARSATRKRRVGRLGVLKTYKVYIGGKFPRTESGRFYQVLDRDRGPLANVCLSSRKDFRGAVVAARAAFKDWSGCSAMLRGQILYRVAEMLEGRCGQFRDELHAQGGTRPSAAREVDAAIDLLVYYAGWADKYQQVFSSVNPVASSHFNFSLREPTGVVSLLAPQEAPLLGLVAHLAPIIACGNTCVALASEARPLAAVSFAEVLHSSDVPGGVVNILTGRQAELLEHFASHMDVNAIVYCGGDRDAARKIETLAAGNIKRVVVREPTPGNRIAGDPYLISDTQEVKTTWHPIGR